MKIINYKTKKPLTLFILMFLSFILVGCNTNNDQGKKIEKPKEEVKEEIEVHLINQEEIKFDRITLSYSTSSVSPPPDGRTLYNFIKVIPKMDMEYKIIGLQDGNEVVNFKFEFNELAKENLKLSLLKNESGQLEIKVEDDNTNKLITIK